ncbi:MAG: hypothetical protein IPM48_11600 [Saprospiraceae bacterium]|nr:hypothetical protein [Saprospiraceae bacterium]
MHRGEIYSKPGILKTFAISIGLLLFISNCVHHATTTDCHSSDCLPGLTGEWQLTKILMYHPDFGIKYAEDVTSIMVGNNPSTLIMFESDYVLAPGSSLHYIPYFGNFQIVLETNQNKMIVKDQAGLIYSISIELHHHPSGSSTLIWEYHRQNHDCHLSQTLPENKFIYQYQKLN